MDCRLLFGAIGAALDLSMEGKKDEASAWMAEACRLIGCSGIVNVHGRELRLDYHAGPRNVVMEAYF